MSLSVNIAGVDLNNPYSRYGHLEVDEIDGWFNAPAIKQKEDARVNADGDVPAPVYYESRYITISGALASKTPQDRWICSDMIQSLLNGEEKKLVIEVDGVARWAMVQPNGQPEIDVVAHRLVNYQLSLKATDPYKYGGPQSFSAAVGSTVDVFHRGTVPAWPIITVTGSLPGGYELILGGHTVQVTKSLATGSTHTLDMRTGILRENGSRVYGSIGIAEYFTVAPGDRQPFYSVPSTTGSGTATVRLNDTYI